MPPPAEYSSGRLECAQMLDRAHKREFRTITALCRVTAVRSSRDHTANLLAISSRLLPRVRLQCSRCLPQRGSCEHTRVSARTRPSLVRVSTRTRATRLSLLSHRMCTSTRVFRRPAFLRTRTRATRLPLLSHRIGTSTGVCTRAFFCFFFASVCFCLLLCRTLGRHGQPSVPAQSTPTSARRLVQARNRDYARAPETRAGART